MPDQYQGQGMGALLLEIMFTRYDKISSSINANAIPKFKNFIRNITAIHVFAFFGSVVFVAIGTTSDTQILSFCGQVGLIATGIAFFLTAAPIGFLFAGHRFVIFIRCFAVYQVLITLFLWASPMPLNTPFLFGLLGASAFLAFVNALKSELVFTRVTTTLIFAALLATIYFPGIRDKFDSRIVARHEPSLVQIFPGDLKLGKIKFFLNGKPNKWYSITPEGKYELFDYPGHNDVYRDELKPVSPELARELIDNENLLSHRSFCYR